MTNAPEGRTYIIKSEALTPEGEERQACGLASRDSDYRQTETPFVVPNGKWVLEGWWYHVISDYDLKLERVKLDTCRRPLEDWITISDKPFGVVTNVINPDAPDLTQWLVRRRLRVARQIHKGELGRTVNTPPLSYARQPFEEGQKLSVTKAHQRRRGYGWVRLCDLAEAAVGYNPDNVIELVLGYSQYSGHLDYRDGHPVGTLIDTICASALEIRTGDVEVVSMTPEQFRVDAHFDSSELWIRRGFAYTILRLQALGVQPSVAQHA